MTSRTIDASHFVSGEDRAESDHRERKGSREDFRAIYEPGGPSNRRSIAQSKRGKQHDQGGPIRERMTDRTVPIEKFHFELLLLRETAHDASAEVNLLQKLCNDPACPMPHT
jgi:hypothetical protein